MTRYQCFFIYLHKIKVVKSKSKITGSKQFFLKKKGRYILYFHQQKLMACVVRDLSGNPIAVDSSEYQPFGREALGVGNYGAVWATVHSPSGKSVVIKGARGKILSLPSKLIELSSIQCYLCQSSMAPSCRASPCLATPTRPSVYSGRYHTFAEFSLQILNL